MKAREAALAERKRQALTNAKVAGALQKPGGNPGAPKPAQAGKPTPAKAPAKAPASEAPAGDAAPKEGGGCVIM